MCKHVQRKTGICPDGRRTPRNLIFPDERPARCDRVVRPLFSFSLLFSSSDTIPVRLKWSCPSVCHTPNTACCAAPRVPACRLYGHCSRRRKAFGVLGSHFRVVSGRRASPETFRNWQAPAPSDTCFPAGLSGNLPAQPAVLWDAKPILAPLTHTTAGTRSACRRETNAPKESEPTGGMNASLSAKRTNKACSRKKTVRDNAEHNKRGESA